MNTTTTTPAPSTPPAVRPEEVWTEATAGTPWCDCGAEHDLSENAVREAAEMLFGPLGTWLTHRQVVLLTMDLWQYESVCRFFLDAVDASAAAVHGHVAKRYPTPTGLSIVGHFSRRWNGCPEELCAGGFDAPA